MGRPIYRKLIITAFVTSIAFGGFSAMNFYIFKELSPRLADNDKIKIIRPGEFHFRKTNHPEGIPGPIKITGNGKNAKNPFFSASNILNNSLFTTGGMLLVWLFNIGLLLLLEKTGIKANRRTWIRYSTSYLMVVLMIMTSIFLGAFNKTAPKIPGTVISGTGNAGIILPDEQATPTFRLRFERSQLPFMTAVVFNTIVLAILELILLQHHKGQVELENTQLKMSHLVARHQHLKHQLHPHFLFNSLNTLKSLIKGSPAAAEEYLVRLSVLLRSSLTKSELMAIPLAEELELCIDYLEMQKMRYGNAFYYEIQIPEPVSATVSVPAFSLQILVENAIKHNVLTIDNPLTIQISYDEEGYIEVRNNKKIKTLREPLSGIGLKNLSERYKMISGNNIVIINTENDFIVKIKALKK